MELKPCTHCEGEPRYIAIPGDDMGYVQCALCGISTEYRVRQRAIKVWNTRPNPWISVKDRLPERGENVLICIKHILNDGLVTYEVNKYYNHWHMGVLYEVTHWMPLPDAPKEEK